MAGMAHLKREERLGLGVAVAAHVALFATAIGLFAAIPAVIAYNRFSHRVNQFEARLQRFADRVHAQVSRELEGV